MHAGGQQWRRRDEDLLISTQHAASDSMSISHKQQLLMLFIRTAFSGDTAK